MRYIEKYLLPWDLSEANHVNTLLYVVNFREDNPQKKLNENKMLTIFWYFTIFQFYKYLKYFHDLSHY